MTAVMKTVPMLQYLASTIIVVLPSCNLQSIPVIASPTGNGPDVVNGYRFPGQEYMPPSSMQAPPQPSVPLFNLLGNLLGGLGALSTNYQPPPPQPAFPGSSGFPYPNQRFPQRGRFMNQPEDSVIECSGPPLPHLIMNPGTHNSQSHESSYDASNKTGFCVSSPMECRGRGGTLLGPCLRFRAPNIPPQIAGACCYFEATCGQSIFVNGTHFRSPNFPDPYPSPGSCQVTVKNTYSNICQVRLDFIVFNLKQPVLGNCNSDRFVVNGQSNNDIIPSICGYNPEQHMYVEVDEGSRYQFSPSSPSNLVTLNIITSGNRNRWFDIKVSYISCDSPFRAPRHCLQYFYELIGQVRSFNYDIFNQGFTYFNNMDYTICIRKWPGFCTVSYNVPTEDEPSESGNDNDLFPERNEINSLKKIPTPVTKSIKIRTNDRQRRPQEIRPPREITSFHIISGQSNQQFAAAGPLKCVTDYIVLNNMRFCGSHLSDDALYRNNVNEDETIIDNSTGPVYARFVTSDDSVSKGFLLDYQLNPCLLNG